MAEEREYEIGSVVLDRDGDAWQLGKDGWTCAVRAINTVDQPTSSLVSILGPLTLLHGPAHDAQVRAEAGALSLREAEFEIRDANGLDPTTRAVVCAVLRGRADRIARAGGE